MYNICPKEGNYMVKSLIDSLTGIHNEIYLKENYQKYLDNNPDANFIMIDFVKFKLINDTFGHNIGDKYLVTFAKILNESFDDSLVVRLHGDEFAILTKYSEERIEKFFELCNQKITLAVLEGKIPRTFEFNAGSVKALHGIDNTKERADLMMYYAKNNHQQYQKFLPSILEKKQEQDDFLENISTLLSQDAFTYTFRQLYDINMEQLNIFRIYAKDKNGNSLFDDEKYNILKSTSKLLQFDTYNIQRLIEKVNYYDRKVIISIDYKSLILVPDILDYLILMKEIRNMSFENIILSININNLDFNNYQVVIDSIVNLKLLGIEICLDKFDSTIGDRIWEDSNVDYIRFSNSYWLNALNNKKIASSIKTKSESYRYCNIIPIFEHIENERQIEFLREFAPQNTLFSGDYFSKEKRLVLKK